MKTIVIAAGYATRLGELTRNFPKPLLKIGNSTILDRMLDDIDRILDIDEHIIVTNHKFAHIFEDWAKERQSSTPPSSANLPPLRGTERVRRFRKPITIIDDGTETNDTRLGAVCDLIYAINGGIIPGDKQFSTVNGQCSTVNGQCSTVNVQTSNLKPQTSIQDDLLVVAADNILFFSFQEFVDFAKAKKTSCIMCHEQPSIEKLQRTGVVELDENNRVLGMEEKPEHPKSHWAVPPFYIYRKEDLDLVRHSVENGCGKDAPGNLAHYMVEHTTMHAWPMSAGRFDIGSLDTYYEACSLAKEGKL